MKKMLPYDLKSILENKRLIFTVTTGRSGTGYLSELLSHLPGVTCLHEAEPDFVSVMREVQLDQSLAEDFWLNKKLPRISKENPPIYIETSHLVCKGFIEPLMELGIIPDLILLSRPHREVALSLMQLGTIPGRTEKALKYYLSPDDPGVLQLKDWQSLHDYQLCYWYCLEIERRILNYKFFFTDMGATAIEISLGGLSSFRELYILLGRLRLPKHNVKFWYKWFRIKNIKSNNKIISKNIVELPSDVDSLEEQVRNMSRIR